MHIKLIGVIILKNVIWKNNLNRINSFNDPLSPLLIQAIEFRWPWHCPNTYIK